MTKGFLKLLSEQIRQQTKKRKSRPLLVGEARDLTLQEPPSDKDWILLGGRLQKSYSFENPDKLQAFVSEILDYEAKTNHSGNIKIGDKMVTVEVFTKGINTVAELDYEYASEADLIYQDVKHY